MGWSIRGRDMTESEKKRAEKIANMQRLVDEGRASGISNETMEEIRTRALRRYRMESAHTDKGGPVT